MIDPKNLSSTATMTFDDEFNALSLWNGVSGAWDTNFWYNPPAGNGSTLSGNGEQEWYINANYAPTSSVKPWTVNNGVLDLTAAEAPQDIQPLIDGYKYTSGMINSYHSFSQTYGYFEMRADLPAGQGFWPAFWLLPADGSWPPELDVMEVLGKDPTKLYTTLHYGTDNAQAQGSATVADMSDGYHTYGVDWEPDTITWYFDGQQVYQAATPADMHKPMYMLANLALGGYWPGMVDGTTDLSDAMHIDYIRAYQSKGVADPGGAAPPPADGNSGGGTGAGSTITAPDDHGSALTGTPGDDVIVASHGADTLTGGAGADVFRFDVLPWSAGHVTDFTPGTDVVDLSGLFRSLGYAGTNPVADGYLSLASDGQGGTRIYVDPDGPGAGSPWPYLVTTLDHVSPNSLQIGRDIGFGGPAAGGGTAPGAGGGGGPAAGSTITAPNDDGSTLMGTAGNDVLIASHGADSLTGGAGADTFQFGVLPWSAGHVTDFTPGTDVLDLAPLFDAAGYHGSDPVADGYLTFGSDGAGSTRVWFDPDGPGSASPWPYLITTLDHVDPSSLVAGRDWSFTGEAASTPSAPDAPSTPGATIAAPDDSGSALTGTGGDDVLIASHGADTLAGGAGADAFEFPVLPWSAGHVVDFQPGTDLLDLRPLFEASGYHGSDPVADHYLSFGADGNGGTQVWFDPDGAGPASPWPYLITTLDHVDPSSLHAGHDWLFA